MDDAGFTKLEEREAWSREGKVVQGGKYYYNRNRWDLLSSADHMFTNPSRTTLVAFTVGEKYQPGGEFKVSLLAKFEEEKYMQHLKLRNAYYIQQFR